MKSEEFLEKAKDLVYEYAIKHTDMTDAIIEPSVFVVWYNFTLGNSKALLSTTYSDGMYYEVTYNKIRDEIYFDAYKKFENKCIKVEEK